MQQQDATEGVLYGLIGGVLSYVKGFISLDIATSAPIVNLAELVHTVIIVILTAVVGTLTTHFVKRVFKIKT